MFKHKRTSILTIALCLMLNFAACTNTSENGSAKVSSTTSLSTGSTLQTATTTFYPETTSTKPDTTSTNPVSLAPYPVGAYLVVIDHLIENSRVNVSARKYLAIDTSKLPDFTLSDKENLFSELEKYKLQLLDKTYEELKAEGYAESGWSFPDGIYIVLQNIRLKNEIMTLDAAIYLNVLYAYGLDDFDVTWLGSHWEITRTHITWVA